jgi:hypothetical protein
MSIEGVVTPIKEFLQRMNEQPHAIKFSPRQADGAYSTQPELLIQTQDVL